MTNSSYYFTNDYTFFPQAQRDDNGSTVDLGYHYDPIDYALCILVSNATMTVLPGTALAMWGACYGIWLDSGANLQFQGLANQPINIGRYNTVQEMSNTNWSTSSLAARPICSCMGQFCDGKLPFRESVGACQ